MTQDEIAALQRFMAGWSRGAAGKQPHADQMADQEAMRGYQKGIEDRHAALMLERDRRGLPATQDTTRVLLENMPASLRNAIKDTKRGDVVETRIVGDLQEVHNQVDFLTSEAVTMAYQRAQDDTVHMSEAATFAEIREKYKAKFEHIKPEIVPSEESALPLGPEAFISFGERSNDDDKDKQG